MKILLWLLTFVSFSAQAYIEEEVHFSVGNGIFLQGYVTKPNVHGVYPALVMQMGSGQGSTDVPTRKYNPFAQTARELADQGFVTLRFDKRGTGYNSGNGSFADGMFSDYVNDFKAAVRTIQKRPDVFSQQVYLFGHSLGGPVVSIVARDFPEIKGIILSASPGRSYADFNLEQMRYYYEYGEKLTGKALDDQMIEVDRANQLIGKHVEYCREFPLNCFSQNGKVYIEGQNSEFWQEIVALNPLESLAELKCAVHSIQGTSDWVISSDHDGGAIARAASKNPGFTAKIIDGLDHFLLKQPSKQGSVQFFVDPIKNENIEIHPDYIPEVASILKTWQTKFKYPLAQ